MNPGISAHELSQIKNSNSNQAF